MTESSLRIHLTRVSVLLVIVLSLSSCNSKKYIKYEGFAQGGTYHVSCSLPDGVDKEMLRSRVDGELLRIDNSLSGYNKGSLLSRLNNGEDLVLDDLFIGCFNRSKEIFEESEGAFDPSAAPLFDLWGFGFTEKGNVSQEAVDSILQFVGMDLFSIEQKEDGPHLLKMDPRCKLNFNAIAQGYSCDVVAHILDSLGCTDYLVDIGREIITKGLNPSGKAWRVGLDKPSDGNFDEGKDLQAIIEVSDKGIVTSGNYRKFYVEDGQKHSHTIDPRTGRPVSHNLLSATVIAADATTADAYATWLMVLGPEKAREMLAGRPELDALLVYGEQDSMKVFQTDNINTD